MPDRFDVIILGAGPAGEVAVNTLLKAGRRIALIEPELIGGECTNWGCVPSKTLLRPAELRGDCSRVAGIATPELAFAELAEYRDYMVSNHDDTGRVKRYEERGVTVIKEPGRLAGVRRVVVGGRTFEAEAVIVATGAEPVIPPLPGLADAGYWTNRDATALEEIPASAVFIGGGVVAVELAQFLTRFGCRVTIVGPDLAAREDPRVGELLREALEEDGIELRLGRRGQEVRVEEGERVLVLDDGSEVRGEVVVVATGRRPRTRDIGLETVGVEPSPRGIPIDDRCRAADCVWAVGDVTGVAMFTHVAKYQARIACADILGYETKADYRAVPRVLFTDPEVASVGLTEADAHAQGIDVAVTTLDLPTSISRPYTYERDPRGTLTVIADRQRKVLVGAWAVAPIAGEWIHQAVLAIRAEVPLDVLSDTIAQFPTFSEAFGSAFRALPAERVAVARDHCAHPMIADPEAAAA
jgi:pyruvate/2-oxoglutarate dehydrogenase complex dihydrolipoamide dehydrogenase (E3) component